MKYRKTFVPIKNNYYNVWTVAIMLWNMVILYVIYFACCSLFFWVERIKSFPLHSIFMSFLKAFGNSLSKVFQGLEINLLHCITLYAVSYILIENITIYLFTSHISHSGNHFPYSPTKPLFEQHKFSANPERFILQPIPLGDFPTCEVQANLTWFYHFTNQGSKFHFLQLRKATTETTFIFLVLVFDPMKQGFILA